jgi:hypothetical protein
LEKEKVENYRKQYFEILELIVSDKFDVAKAETIDYLNDYLKLED